eukprot:TRINITY_DN304_c0_g2_i1.p1 TRINITY_DN304_c0_g2~~TRINITY_DN304_c0_g2_i1.p1  ORF type:complete len:317 (+),score=116.71 TRINITY_DN304_c0_g2_i1:79-1029(+)
MALRTCGAVSALLLSALVWALGFSQLARPEFPSIAGGVVLVSGGSTGIGLDASAELARQGFTVLAGVRKDSDMAAIDGMNVKGLSAVKLDVTQPESVQAAVRKAEAAGRLVAVVANAGVAPSLPMETLLGPGVDSQVMQQTYDVNVVGAARLIGAALPQLRSNKGRAVLVGSVAGKVGGAMCTSYCASKFAMEGMADSLRRELLAVGMPVSVSMVNPGCVTTPILQKTRSFLSEAPPDQVAMYQQLYDKIQKQMDVCPRGFTPDHTTTPAIVDALTSAYPKTRYYPAGFDGVPARVIITLQWLLPDRVMDWVVTNL